MKEVSGVFDEQFPYDGKVYREVIGVSTFT
jgi:hypothetical protein